MLDVLYVVEIAVALGLILSVHELGHLLVAKAFGVWVRRFAIGFGTVLVKWQRGETEYSLRAIPLGGFNELMGDHPDSEGGDDPRALWRRPAWQRILIFAAGSLMNLALAIVFFTVASLVGLSAPTPTVGGVTPLFPADKAGIKAGDRIVALNGEPIQSFEDIMRIVTWDDAGTPFDVTVDRPAGEGKAPERITFPGVRSRRDPGDVAPRLGIEPAAEPVIHAMVPGFPDEQAGLKVGDRILAVNGTPIVRFGEINDLLEKAPAGPVTLTIQREESRQELTVDPAKLHKPELGMAPLLAVGAVDEGSPAAKAEIQPGDRVLRVGDVSWPTTEQLKETVEAAGDGGKVSLVLRRGDKVITVVSGVAVYGDRKEPRIGIAMGPANAAPIQVGAVAPDGPAAKAGIQPGDVVEAVGKDGIEPRSWEDLYAALAGAKALSLRVRRGESELSTSLVAAQVPVERFKLIGSQPLLILYEPQPRIYNPLTAAARGFDRAWIWVCSVYRNLQQMLKGEIGRKAFGGPVLIVKASLSVASRGFGTFIDFWGMLSVCVAVFNFLPLPPFDGGHVVFVLLEKIKGSPLGLKVRAWIWGAGWAAVGALFIFLMWQDIARL